jgi:predicted small secreted protein
MDVSAASALKAPFHRASRLSTQDIGIFVERTFMLKRLIVLMLALTAVALSACNTVQGVGKDVQKAGEKLEDAAKKK